MFIREAIVEDAIHIAKVHVDSWRTTYTSIMPDHVLNHLSYEQREELWKGNIADKHSYVIVAVNEGGQIVGFADAWINDSKQNDLSFNLNSIYILQHYQGKGIGKLLLHKLFEHINRYMYKAVHVEVLAQNNARYFYEHFGATILRSEEIEIGGKKLEKLVYAWDNNTYKNN